jgi:hypothetical protein
MALTGGSLSCPFVGTCLVFFGIMLMIGRCLVLIAVSIDGWIQKYNYTKTQ